MVSREQYREVILDAFPETVSHGATRVIDALLLPSFDPETRIVIADSASGSRLQVHFANQNIYQFVQMFPKLKPLGVSSELAVVPQELAEPFWQQFDESFEPIDTGWTIDGMRVEITYTCDRSTSCYTGVPTGTLKEIAQAVHSLACKLQMGKLERLYVLQISCLRAPKSSTQFDLVHDSPVKSPLSTWMVFPFVPG